GPAEQARVVLVPTHAFAASKRLADLVFVGDQGRDRVVYTQYVEGAVLVRQGECVLGGQRVAVGLRVVGDVAAGGLVAKPLPPVPLSRSCSLRHLGRRERPRPSHRLVEPELLSNHEQRHTDRRSHVAQRLPHETFELRLVNLSGTHYRSSYPRR